MTCDGYRGCDRPVKYSRSVPRLLVNQFTLEFTLQFTAAERIQATAIHTGNEREAQKRRYTVPTAYNGRENI